MPLPGGRLVGMGWCVGECAAGVLHGAHRMLAGLSSPAIFYDDLSCRRPTIYMHETRDDFV